MMHFVRYIALTEQGYEAWNEGLARESLYTLEVMDFKSLADPS